MAKGITQDQVDTAADALVQAGERPTVERIRAFLGTGSPNTVTRMLETWWQKLGARLTNQHARMDLPAAPPKVSSLAGQLWEEALLAAQAHAQEEMAVARATLDAERIDLQNAQQFARSAVSNAVADVEAARQAQVLAEARLAESQRLIEQQATQLTDLGRQREALEAQCAVAEQAAQTLRDRLQTQETAAAAERDSLAKHVRTVEDRAHAEIDRTREEAKALRREHASTARENAAVLKTLHQELKTAQTATIEARREASREQARAQALESQLAKFAELPAKLEASLSLLHQAKSSKAPGKRKTTKVRAG